MTEWMQSLGDRTKGTKLQRRYGDTRRSGGSPGTQTPNVLIFSDAALGEPYGYVEGWKDDGCVQRVGRGTVKTASLNP
jgi:hypothetical protein